MAAARPTAAAMRPVPDAMTPEARVPTPDEPPWRPFVAAVRAFVAKRVRAEDAEDVAQDVLLRLHTSAASLRDRGAAQAWVFGVARRTVADYHRRRYRREPELARDVDVNEVPTASEAPGFASFDGDHDVHEEVLSWLRPLVDELSDRDREVLLLADFGDLTQREVAGRLGISLSGTKSRVQRARTRLAQALARCCEVALGPDGRAVDFRRRDCDC